ncbi:MAG: hypothetical protein KatS3mg104_1064 [Phycisphaerae bacterium]|jgi:hypothetical protein|nr:MAG: hypothetical protein KatS3mg104_1064 [Phycisphaerae bacterium]
MVKTVPKSLFQMPDLKMSRTAGVIPVQKRAVSVWVGHKQRQIPSSAIPLLSLYYPTELLGIRVIRVGSEWGR